MPKETPATWPDRFVYVCAASQGATTTHAPLHHAGAERLAGMVILCALSSPNRPSSADRANALVPAERLRAAAVGAMGLPPDRVQILTGHADLLAPWTDALHVAAEMARKAGAEIVLNVTSGRKSATLGALLGAPRGPDVPPLVMISHGLDGTIRRIDLSPDGSLRERPLPGKAGFALETYLGCYGLRVLNGAKRAKAEARLLDREAAYAVLEAALPQEPFRLALAKLQGRIAMIEAKFPLQVPLAPKVAEGVAPLVAAMDDASLCDDTLTLASPAAQRFLSGIWLEGLVLRALREALGGEAGLTIHQGVEVAGDAAARAGLAETDFDLLLLSGDRLGLIECKAGQDSRSARQGLVRLAQYRTQLAAQAGAGWLVAPLASGLAASGVVAQAAERGLGVLTGPGAVTDLVARVRDWQGAAKPRPAPGSGSEPGQRIVNAR